ncbi:hypothetical protein [Micromonospora sp. NPDC093277]|uniref:hypothetical protein n=1 Tax=Micromonospora sp. NPDC093277 TaxID=3364291 RepID=UPI00380D581E
MTLADVTDRSTLSTAVDQGLKPRPEASPRSVLPRRTSLRFASTLATCLLGLGLAACSDDTVELGQLPDPCPLITDDMLTRLAPGSAREPDRDITSHGATLACSVDLNAADGFRGDLRVTVIAESLSDYNPSYSEKTQTEECDGIGAPLSQDGPGDRSCFAVRQWDGSQSRIDGWAFVGDHYAARVAYQLQEPQQFPAGAEQDLRGLLGAAAASLPADRRVGLGVASHGPADLLA